MKFTNLSFLIKPSSSMCNLICSYCFYADVSNHRAIKNYGFLSKESANQLIDKAIASTYNYSTITFGFQGGEPTLIGLDFFQYFIEQVNQKRSNRTINYAIQTNGTLLDESWIKFFKKHNFMIGISLDGYQENHDQFRYNAQKQGQYKRVLNAIGLLKEHEIPFNILTVLTKQLSQEPEKLYHYYKKQNFEYIQLIPCLPDFDKIDETNSALTPKDFYNFYKIFYRLWKEDNQPFQVSLFNDILNMFAGYPPLTCGMLGNCALHFIVEGDGSVYPCDFYVLDQYKIGNILEDSIEAMIQTKNAQTFLAETKRMSKLCQACKFKGMCNGNCKRMNVVYFDKNYCGYQLLLEDMFKDLHKMV